MVQKEKGTDWNQDNSQNQTYPRGIHYPCAAPQELPKSVPPRSTLLLYLPTTKVSSSISFGSHTALKGVRYRLKSWLWTNSTAGSRLTSATWSHTRRRLSWHVVSTRVPDMGLNTALLTTWGCAMGVAGNACRVSVENSEARLRTNRTAVDSPHSGGCTIQRCMQLQIYN